MGPFAIGTKEAVVNANVGRLQMKIAVIINPHSIFSGSDQMGQTGEVSQFGMLIQTKPLLSIERIPCAHFALDEIKLLC